MEDDSSVDGTYSAFYPTREGLAPSLFFRLMRIRILFFASYRDLLGIGDLTMALSNGATVADMVAELRGRGDPFHRLPASPVVAVNEEYAADDRVLRDGDLVAFIPPVAGG